MQMVLSRGLAPERVITHRLPLAEAAEAYRLFDSRTATKVVLLPLRFSASPEVSAPPLRFPHLPRGWAPPPRSGSPEVGRFFSSALPEPSRAGSRPHHARIIPI